MNNSDILEYYLYKLKDPQIASLLRYHNYIVDYDISKRHRILLKNLETEKYEIIINLDNQSSYEKLFTHCFYGKNKDMKFVLKTFNKYDDIDIINLRYF